MNAAYLHLLLCHLPTFATLFALALLAAAALRRDDALFGAALVGFVIAAVSAAPTYLSGDGARAVVERAPGIADAMIDAHRDDALPALVASTALGAAALLGLWRLRRHGELERWLRALVWLLGLGAAAALIWVSARGGRIRHPEVARIGSRAPISAALRAGGAAVPRPVACAVSASDTP